MAVVILMSAAGAFVVLVEHTDFAPALNMLSYDLATKNSTEITKTVMCPCWGAQEESFIDGRNFKDLFKHDKKEDTGHSK